MEHLSNDHKGCTSQHENSHKLCDEMGHPIIPQQINFTGKLEEGNGATMFFITKNSKNLF